MQVGRDAVMRMRAVTEMAECLHELRPFTLVDCTQNTTCGRCRSCTAACVTAKSVTADSPTAAPS